MPSAMAQSGTYAGRFDLVECLGEGGWGTVYRAYDRERDRLVALKVLRRANADGLRRFKREFRSLADISHPNVVRLDELIEHEGRWALTMELVEGRDLVSFVRETAGNLPYDEPRLRDALTQLVMGLNALHAAGLVHRDIKPNNVRVTPEGRVVLLDFGLIVNLVSSDRNSTTAGLGTVAYMAPEQVEPTPVGPEVDFYALGVLTFELLTGSLPFDGSSLQILLSKQRETPPRPSHRGVPVPPDLDALVVSMLDPDPKARPGAARVLEVLGSSSSGPPSGVLTLGTRDLELPFVGREDELDLLVSRFELSKHGEPQLVLVEGESGIGKTALLAELTRRLPDSYVLRSRCFERESATYKAFDGIAEALASRLRRLPDNDAKKLLPRRPGMLVRMFPSLARVQAFQRSSANDGPRDQSTVLRLACESLRDLFARVSDLSPVVIVLDDLQWADTESLSVLEALLDHDLPTRICVVATSRPLATVPVPIAESFYRLFERTDVTRIVLEPLRIGEARALAARVLGRAEEDPDVQRVASESGGHPMFLSELVTHATYPQRGAASPPSLEQVLRERVERLDVAQRRVLELLAIATQTRRDVLLRALGSSAAEGERALFELRSARLVRSSSRDAVICFHDRIRVAVLAAMDPASFAEKHRLLARALMHSSDRDPMELAHHWLSAGEPARAVPALIEAAERAMEALAFTKAATAYAAALEHVPQDSPEPTVRELRTAHARALVGAGLHRDASAQLLLAAANAPAESAVALRREAASLLMRGGHLEEGVALTDRLLADIGFVHPKSAFAARAKLLYRRARLLGRFGNLEPLHEEAIPSFERTELDFMQSVIGPKAWLDALGAADLTLAYIDRALRARHPLHLAHAVAHEITSRLRRGVSPEHIAPLMARHVELAEQLGARYAADAALYETGWHLLRADARRCLESATLGEELTSREVPPRPWERASFRVYMLCALHFRGELARMSELAERWLRDARARGDAFEESYLALVGAGSIRLLFANRPEACLEEAHACAARFSADACQMPNLGALVLESMVHLYRGDPDPYAPFARTARSYARSPLWRSPYVRALWLDQACRTAIASALARPEARTERLLDARRWLEQLRATSTQLALMRAADLGAQLTLVDGDRSRACSELRHAVDTYRKLGHEGWALPLQVLLGRTLGGDEGGVLERNAFDALAHERWREPLRFVQTIAVALPVVDVR